MGVEDVRAAVSQIVELMGREFHRRALVELSTRSADFVEKLAPMDKPAKGIVEADREGRVQFTMPFLSDYVLKHGAHRGTTPSNTPTTSLHDLLNQEPAKHRQRGEVRESRD